MQGLCLFRAFLLFPFGCLVLSVHVRFPWVPDNPWWSPIKLVAYGNEWAVLTMTTLYEVTGDSDVTVLSLVAHSQSHLESCEFPAWRMKTWRYDSLSPGGVGRGCVISASGIFMLITLAIFSPIFQPMYTCSCHTLFTLLSLGNKFLVFSIGRGRGSHPVIPNG